MPKSTRQRRGEIINAMRKCKKEIIVQDEYLEFLEDSQVGSPSSIKEYTAEMIRLNQIERAPGGFRLIGESREDGLITIRVTPRQNTNDVKRVIKMAVQQCYPLAVLE